MVHQLPAIMPCAQHHPGLGPEPVIVNQAGGWPLPGSGWPRLPRVGWWSPHQDSGPCLLPLACCGQPGSQLLLLVSGAPLVYPGLEPSTLLVRPVLPQLQASLVSVPSGGLSSHHWLQKPLGPRPSQLQAFTKTRLPRCRMNWGEAGGCAGGPTAHWGESGKPPF